MQNPQLNKDIHFKLFLFNCSFVILGYGINTITGQALLTPVKAIRMLVLGVSIILLIRHYYYSTKDRNFGSYHFLLLYIILSGTIFSYNISYSLNRAITFLFPIFYLMVFFKYATSKYSISAIGKEISNYFQITYAIPILVFAIFERSFGSTYLKGDVQAFVRNHYGWSSILFLLCSADLLLNYKVPNWRKWLTLPLLPIAFYILLASGSRSSWLALALTSLVFLVRLNSIPIWVKPLLFVVASIPIFSFLNDSDSALYARWEKTQLQLEKGEDASDRIYWLNLVLHEFNENPTRWLTGRGFFNYEGLPFKGYHNSYYEILFGCGVFVFAYFLYLFLLRPAYFYFRYYSKYFLTFFPLVIIPFFESNLTGGQFLFFPWFTYMMFYSIDPVAHHKMLRRKMERSVNRTRRKQVNLEAKQPNPLPS